jgi:PAS domain-containing protein
VPAGNRRHGNPTRGSSTMKSDPDAQPTQQPRREETDQPPSPKRLLIVTALAVFLGEFLVMLILAVLPPMATVVEALADGMMITILASPFLYLFLFRPMREHIQVRARAEQELRTLNDRLEALVGERTEDLTQTNRRLSREIEEHRRTADSLRRNNEFIERVVDSQRCSYVNSRVTDLLGYGQDELALAKDNLIQGLIDARDRSSFRETMHDLVNGPEGHVARGTCGFIASTGQVVSLRFGMTVLSRTPTMEAKDLLLTAMPISA